MRFILVALIAVALVAPIALAAPEDPDETTTITLIAPISYVVIDEGGAFLDGPDVDTLGALRVQIWEETNQVPGLQRVAYEDENGRIIPSDEQAF